MCAASDLVRISLAALSALALTGSAAAQVTSLGGFSPSTTGPITSGTGSGSASGGNGAGLITLRAECSAEDTPEGTCKIARRTVGSVSVGPLRAQLETLSQLFGTLEIEENNSGPDRATVSVAGLGVTNSHSFAMFNQGTQGVSDLLNPVVCLAPGVHVITTELTTEAIITPDGFLFPTDVNSSDFDGSGLQVTFTEVAGETYCTAGTSAGGCQGLISGVGMPSASAAIGFELDAAGQPGGGEGIFFFGTSGRQANAWGNGTSFQCVVPPVSRTLLILAVGTVGLCDGLSKFDLNAYWCPACPKPAKNPGQGATVQAPFWYRDPFNTSNQTTSLSDAFEFCVGPRQGPPTKLEGGAAGRILGHPVPHAEDPPMLSTLAALLTLSSLLCIPATGQDSPQVLVQFSAEARAEAADGRLLLLLSTAEEGEPRFGVRGSVQSAQVFGIDVDGLEPGAPVVFGPEVFGHPAVSLSDIPAGEYTVQAVLHLYETFEVAHGHTLKLPMDRGEGQHWNRAPGNLYSTPVRVRFDPASTEPLEVVLDQVIAAIEPPADTQYIKHIRIQSELLSAFWGRPMFLGAHVLLPEGFEDHPNARYPLAIFHGHHPTDFGGFRPEPPDPDLAPVYSERFGVAGYNIIQQQEAYDFYRKWTGPDFPRFIAIEIQHANPFYDDSYAVNSANLGPYGDAITHELVPYIEQQFRGLGEGWARFLYGGSTGGWEALAVQIFYPDEYNGCFAACPDPVDFRSYCLVNIYENENAYWSAGSFGRVERPAHRNWLGQVDSTMRTYNHMELALGTHSRSGDQWDIWQAVYSPVGEDGYPKPIWDKLSGEIDREVADYWRDNYDLRHILERDWETLGPKLAGKLHVFCGDMDNYYLNNAVYQMEEFLESTSAPYYGGVVDYGDRAEHCWNGDQENGNHISRLRYNTMYLPRILERIAESAPAGADLTSWRY